MPLKPGTRKPFSLQCLRQMALPQRTPGSLGTWHPAPAAPAQVALEPQPLRTVAAFYPPGCGTINELVFIKGSQLLRRALQKYKWVIITTAVINESKLLREYKVHDKKRGKARKKPPCV